MGSCLDTNQYQMPKKIQHKSNINSYTPKPNPHSKHQSAKPKQIPQKTQNFHQYDHHESQYSKYTDKFELANPKPTSIEPQLRLEQSYKPRGIPNLGNTCYMNSVLQCLHKSKHFLNKLAQTFYACSNKEGRQLSHNFLNFISKMDSGDHEISLQLQRIKEIIASRNYIFDNYKQQDATEFFSTFLSIISQELNYLLHSQHDTQQTLMAHYIKKEVSEAERAKKISKIYQNTIQMDDAYCRSIVDETFTGRYQVTYSCGECKADYILFQKFNIHYLPIPDKPSQNQQYNYYHYRYKADQPCEVLECLEEFKRKDTLAGEDRMTCDACEDKSIRSYKFEANQYCKRETKQSRKPETDQSKTMQIYEANQIFVIGIKRFFKGYKNQTKVKFPTTLQPQQIMLNHKNPRYAGKLYKMYAVILHYGTLHSGHYVAYCLNQTTNTWVQYNDSTTRQLGGFKSIDFGNAYAVFYKLCDSRQIEKDVNQQGGKLSPKKQSSQKSYYNGYGYSYM